MKHTVTLKGGPCHGTTVQVEEDAPYVQVPLDPAVEEPGDNLRPSFLMTVALYLRNTYCDGRGQPYSIYEFHR